MMVDVGVEGCEMSALLLCLGATPVKDEGEREGGDGSWREFELCEGGVLVAGGAI